MNDDVPFLMSVYRVYGNSPACVRVAGPDASVPARYDSVIPHIFTDWMAVMTDRTAPIQVFVELSGEGVHPGEPGFVARIPRARPDVLNAFAPTDEGDSAPPAAAIGSAVGAPSPLSGVSPD